MPISITPAPATPFNPHAPGAIGDVTPGTGAFTTLGATGLLTSSSANLINTTYNGDVVLIQKGGATWLRYGNSGADGVLAANLVFNASTYILKWQDGGLFKVSGNTLMARNTADDAYYPIQGKLTTDTNATTGLGAGLLAATTNATVTVYDASGQAYRVPCII